MVVGERFIDEGRSGRRSRASSPNGNLSDDSSASDDSEQDSGMRVGEDFQAVVQEFCPNMKADTRAEAMLVWAPHPNLLDCKMDEYIHIAKEKHGYNTEQALGMLFWHKHMIDKALSDLANFTPFPDEWTVEDRVLFEQAFSFHGKGFHRIRQMLPDKSLANLVKHYYSWKKTRSRMSLMDKHARKFGDQRRESDDEMGGSGNSDSDFETVKEPREEHRSNGFMYMRPTPGSKKPDLQSRLRSRRKPPRGMYLKQADLMDIAKGPPGHGETMLKQLDTDLVSLKRQVQNNKQIISMNKQKVANGIEALRAANTGQKITARWSNEELLLAVQGVRKYGKNFEAIADVINNKTEAHVRSFFVNYRRRYNLDEVLAEYDRENGLPPRATCDLPEKMEIEENGSTTQTTSVNNQSGVKPTTVKPTTETTQATISQPLQPPLLVKPAMEPNNPKLTPAMPRLTVTTE